eukprot:s2665_g1.t1
MFDYQRVGQLLCQDTSESIELASTQLVSQLTSAGQNMERMRQEATRGYGRLGDVLEGLKDADDRKRSGLKGLAEIDVVKTDLGLVGWTRVETACNALREVGSWERKVKDCEQMVHAGNLGEALGQLQGLKGVLDAFRMLPEFARKSEQLNQLQDQLLFSARRRARSALEKNSAEELRACSEVFHGMQRQDEAVSIANSVLLDLCERAWSSQGARAPSSPGDVAAAAQATFQALAQALEERWPLLQALEASAEDRSELCSGSYICSGLPPSYLLCSFCNAILLFAQQAQSVSERPAASPHSTRDSPPALVATTVKAALAALAGKLLDIIGDGKSGAQVDEATANQRASMAVGLLGVYVDGFARLQQLSAMQPEAWQQVCAATHEAEALPWPLLREVVRFVLLRPMEDDAAALAPQGMAQSSRPSEAVLAAESNATRLLQMPSTWSRRLESQGAAQLAVPWLACVDEANAAYWRQWEKLVGIFDNTLKHRSAEAANSGASGFDSAFLQEVMQLHSVLHDNLQSKFTTFQADVMQQVGQLRFDGESSAFGMVLKEKMKDPQWPFQLGIPSESSLRSAADFIEGSASSGVLPAAAAALSRVENQVREVVTRCCAEPVVRILKDYPEMPEWNLQSDEIAHGPLQCITLVPEHLFSLMPQLEKSQEGSELQWLPAILEASVDVVVDKVLKIKELTPAGASQLAVDLEYLRKVPDALGSTGGADGAAVRLKDLLETVEYLAGQQRRKKECMAQGVTYVEETRSSVPSRNRTAERPLRLAPWRPFLGTTLPSNMEVYDHAGDPVYWFWLRVSCVTTYVLVAARSLAPRSAATGHEWG